MKAREEHIIMKIFVYMGRTEREKSSEYNIGDKGKNSDEVEK